MAQTPHNIMRRTFLKTGALSVVAFGAVGTPLFLTRAAAETSLSPANGLSAKRRKILVTIFQRGAMDGLMAVTPFTDPNLVKFRPRLTMNVGNGASNLIDLNGTFALHPAFAAFEPLFKEQRLAIVHGMGSPNTTRSHFDAQDYMETGTPDRKGTASGWLNRASALASQKAAHASATPFQAVALTSAMPRSLYGDAPALAVANLDDFGVRVGTSNGAGVANNSNIKITNGSAQGFESLYEQTSQRILRGAGQDSFDAVKLLSGANLKAIKPAAGVNYPASPLGENLRQIAQLIKADVGLEIAFAESGGWDTHVQQGTTNGVFARRAKDLADTIAAFWKDIEPFHDDVVLMTMTEFGRTVRENGSGGTDHGRASCLFVLGNAVEGGKIHGSLPELAPENLADGRDVPVTTDFRAVFADVAGKHLDISHMDTLFPGWQGTALPIIRG